MKKDSLIKGTLILALAALIARVLGVLQKVPLKHLLGDEGMASFGIAYNIYFLLLIVATAGIPSALSKLISERSETGRMDEARRIYGASMRFAALTGFLLTALLIVGAPYYAEYIADDPEATLAIRALAPALLLFPMIAMMRGYFQGLQFMLAGGLSQIVEQILRVGTAVLLAYVLLEQGYSREVAVAGASFGGVMGSVGAFGIMLYYYWRFRKDHRQHAIGNTAEQASIWHIYKLIFTYSIPITFSALAVPIINFIDSSTVIPLLKGSLGYGSAKEALGILVARAQSLAGIPIILAIAVSQTALPVISSAYARGDQDEVNRRASQAMWLSSVFGLWIVLMIVLAARPLNGFIFGDTKGTETIILLTITALLQIVMMTTVSIMNGLGFMHRAAAHVYVGIAVKLAATFLLSRWIGMAGVIGSTFLCFAVIAILNYRVMRRHVTLQVLTGRWTAMIGVVAGTVLAGVAAEWLVTHYVYGDSTAPVHYLLQCIMVGSITAAVYLVLLFVFRIVKEQQLEFLPARLQRLAARMMR